MRLVSRCCAARRTLGRGATVEDPGFDAVAALMFGSIERFVGRAEERFGVDFRTIRRIAEAGGNGKESGAGGDGFSRNRGSNPFGQSRQIFWCFGGDNQELFSAITPDRVTFVQHVLNPFGGGDENQVASGVSVHIVDLFKLIEVEHDDPERRTGLLGGFHLVG